MVSTASGYDHLATMLRKKLLYVNYSESDTLELLNANQLPLFIPKKLVWLNTGIPLTGTEILETGANSFHSNSQYESFGIKYIDNTENEILEAVIEMDLRIKGIYKEDVDSKKLQNDYKKKFTSNFIKEIEKIPNIGNKFLLENQYLLK
jgi:putative glycosyltransferase (TIGR04372 family)